LYHSTLGWRVIKKKKREAPDFLENNYFTEMCSGSEAGSYLRLIDLVLPDFLEDEFLLGRDVLGFGQQRGRLLIPAFRFAV